MISVSTHVLDLVEGGPAEGVPVLLERLDNVWIEVRRASTDGDGRVRDLATSGPPGTWRITFDTAAFFAHAGTKGFYPYVQIAFLAERGHYHVPILLGPYGYSTYRGS